MWSRAVSASVVAVLVASTTAVITLSTGGADLSAHSDTPSTDASEDRTGHPDLPSLEGDREARGAVASVGRAGRTLPTTGPTASAATTTTVSWGRSGARVVPAVAGSARPSSSGGMVAAEHVIEPDVAPGGWIVRLRASGTGQRVRIEVDGDRIAEMELTGSSEIAIPVWWRATDRRLAVRSLTGAVRLESLELERAEVGMTTRGTSIIGTDGRPVVLRGIQHDSLQAKPKGWYYTLQNADVVRSWGANVVRLPVTQRFWLDDSCHHDPQYPSNVWKAVAQYTSRGMTVIIDLHHVDHRNRLCSEGNAQPMADRRSIRFWTEVAAAFADYPNVIFDLYNEPYRVTPSVWRNGGDAGGWEAAGMQELYEAVRSTGARNPVIVSGLSFGQDLRPALSHPLDGYGIILGTHLYFAHDRVPDYVAGWVEPALASWPVLVSEFGDNHLTGGVYAGLVIEWATRHGLGWIAHHWAAGDGSKWELFRSWSTYEPTDYGRVVRDALR